MNQKQPVQHMRARPGGGFNMGGDEFGEHLDDKAMAQAAQAHQQTQNAADPSAVPTSGIPQEKGGKAQPGESQSFAEYLKSELGDGVVDSLAKTFLGPLGIETLLTPNENDTPEEKQKKVQMLQRWGQINEEQKQAAQLLYKQDMEKKKQEQEEEMLKKQQEEERKAQTLVMPSSPKRGHAQGGSGKQRAEQTLEQQRKTLSQASGSN